ncbi:flavodoxin [Ureibacillus terrenus]|uniref:Flavodoxin n=2 Tax=Ureibacillus TaxID=160795 RepID=A0A540UWF0_9BACL|nr:flavodoxin [Ureibacillus thermophilus]TQE88830.1 flavodoxin [Ureibacillus terrenus]
MVSKLKALIAYLSYSGNTKEVAEIIEEVLKEKKFQVDMHRIGVNLPINLKMYDLIFIGTFTWAKGALPIEVKDFVWEIGYKPKNIAVFGTGDTQFGGDELFCLAAVKLARFYNSRWEPLKIEQSPRGSQEKIVKKWIEGIVKDVTKLA